MNTQISATTFRSDRRYSGVYQQQGRMLRDADWNELVDVIKARLSGALGDVIGSGLPAGGSAILSPAGPQFGRAYVDGIAAELVARSGVEGTPDPYRDQADFPGAPPTPAGPYVLYLDVWERVVLGLEDQDLLDVALHGADTTSRTQVLAQLKWCPAPEAESPPASDDRTQNPTSGTATFTAQFRQGAASGSDPCDPCAEVIDAQAPVGNYLFRLEVHSVDGPAGNPTGIVLKWSSENGAEQHPIGATPPGFDTGGYVYETFDADSDRQLGVHLAPGFTPTRGALSTTLPTTGPGYVRRWDGALALRFGDGVTLGTAPVAASDLGVPLVNAADLSSHGNVTLGASLGLALQSLSVNLTLSGQTFVAGDYWLALVRELTAEPSVVSAQPLGIIHHYLTLGEVSGATFTPAPGATRRFAFPALTNLQARDVGYANADCANGLFASAATVADALNALCDLNATEVAYAGSDCPNSVVADTKTVQAAIDALCALNATEIPYDPGTCQVLTGATTVAGALDLLCAHAAQGDDFCLALLRLFGRGVINGLIPSVTVSAPAAGSVEVPVSISISDGTVIDGRGCVIAITGVPTLQTTLPALVFEGLDIPPAVSVDQSVHAIQNGLAAKSLTGIVPTEQLQPLARMLVGQTFASTADLTSHVAAVTGISDVNVIGAIAGGLGSIGRPVGLTPTEVKRWLYLVTTAGQNPQLELRPTPPAGGMTLPTDVVAALDTPASGPSVDAGATCATAETEAWQMYTDVPAVASNGDGAVCLGVIGAQGQAAWSVPDDREQVFPTPAVTSARWRMQRQAVYDSVKAACLAGSVTISSIVLGQAGGPALAGRSILGASSYTVTVLLDDVVRGAALTISFQSSAGVTVHGPLTLQPGQQSGTVTFDVADVSGPQTITAVIDSQRQFPAAFTAVQLQAPVLAGGATAVMSGDAIGVSVSLSSAPSDPVAVNLSAANVSVNPPTITIPAGSTSASGQLTVNAPTIGTVQVAASAQGQSRTLQLTAVGLQSLVQSNGAALNGSRMVQGDEIDGISVTLTSAAPHAITVAVGTDAGLAAAPTTVAIAAGQAQSGTFNLTGTRVGAWSARGSYGALVVSALVTVSSGKSIIKDNKEARDNPRGVGQAFAAVNPAPAVVNPAPAAVDPAAQGGAQAFIGPALRPAVGGAAFNQPPPAA